MLSFSCDRYTLSATVGCLPTSYSVYASHAVLNEDLGIRRADGTALFFSVYSGTGECQLAVALRFEGFESGFYPGFLLIPESDLLLVGAGTYLLAYELSPGRRLWEDYVTCGFWGWKRHGDIVLMLGELEFAALDLRAQRLWSTPVEPPWSYDVRGDEVELDVMGRISSFNIASGPAQR